MQTMSPTVTLRQRYFVVITLTGLIASLISWRWITWPSQVAMERLNNASKLSRHEDLGSQMQEFSLKAENSIRHIQREIKENGKGSKHTDYVHDKKETILKESIEKRRSEIKKRDKTKATVKISKEQQYPTNRLPRTRETTLSLSLQMSKSQRDMNTSDEILMRSGKTSVGQKILARDSRDRTTIASKITTVGQMKQFDKMKTEALNVSERLHTIQDKLRRSRGEDVLSAQKGQVKESPIRENKNRTIPQIDAMRKTKDAVKTSSLHKRYLVYLCDGTTACSGLADRQRAIVGLYLLSIATNRTFGIIMTSPTNITDFYVPNKVDWNLKPGELAGKRRAYQKCIYRGLKCHLNDINNEYPQDVLYVTTIDDFIYTLGWNRHYRKNLPEWATGSRVLLFGLAWINLMTPTSVLRQGVNSLLLEIATVMQQDQNVIPIIQESPSCRDACHNNGRFGRNQSVSILNKCIVNLSNYTNVKEYYGIDILSHLCPIAKAFKPSSLESIRESTGYDYVELELVCVHVRLGSNSSIQGEGREFNKFQDVVKIWDHVRPYINKGHHLYLASDSQKVKDQAKIMFGPRVHINSDPIIHIDKVRKKQSGWQAMKTTLVEQLLLTTSCKILIYSSRSGFSSRAAMIRHALTRDRTGFETFSFAYGKVNRVDLDLKPKTLPSPK